MLSTLRTLTFRNLADATWQPAPGVNLLLGGNGTGKTSLLEAAYLLATTRSFRTADLADCVRRGADGFYLDGAVGDEGRTRIELGWQRGGGRHRRLDGSEVPAAAYLEALPVVVWNAGTAQVLVGPPAQRRRLIDRGVVATRPARVEVLGRFRRALRQKRRLLAEGRGDLESWNRVFAEVAAELAAARADYVDRLSSAWQEVVASVDLDLPPLSLRYAPSPAVALAGAAAIGDELVRLGRRERERRLPLVGPQRDDLELLWPGGVGLERMASAGEIKAIGLLLAAAQARVLERARRPPLLLLDDADAELDPDRLGAAWPAFAGIPQVLATSARERVWEGVATAARWRLASGLVTGPEPDPNQAR